VGLGTNFQLASISDFFYCIIQPCHALSIQHWVTCHVSCDSDASCPWYRLSHQGQMGFVFFSSWTVPVWLWLWDL
jgi:hypothetical protein